MKDDKARFTLRTSQELLNKFGYISEYYGRSKNKELEHLMRKRVSDYEKKYEKIPEEVYKRDPENEDQQ